MPDVMSQPHEVGAVSAEPEAPSVVMFPEGLVGLPEAKRFVFDRSQDLEPLLRMRCVDRSDLSLLVVDPDLVVGKYRPKLPAGALLAAGLSEGEPVVLLAVARISPRIDECTANLLAPLLINPGRMQGLQVILEPGSYSPRHPLVTDGAESS